MAERNRAVAIIFVVQKGRVMLKGAINQITAENDNVPAT